jgi:hypothetical protein
MKIRVWDAAVEALPGQRRVRVECLACGIHYDGDYIPSGDRRDRRKTLEWLVEQCAGQLKDAGCSHVEDAELLVPD